MAICVDMCRCVAFRGLFVALFEVFYGVLGRYVGLCGVMWRYVALGDVIWRYMASCGAM